MREGQSAEINEISLSVGKARKSQPPAPPPPARQNQGQHKCGHVTGLNAGKTVGETARKRYGRVGKLVEAVNQTAM